MRQPGVSVVRVRFTRRVYWKHPQKVKRGAKKKKKKRNKRGWAKKGMLRFGIRKARTVLELEVARYCPPTKT